MFVRSKSNGDRTYLQIVENRWEVRPVKAASHHHFGGRLDRLQESGQLMRCCDRRFVSR